MADLLSLIHSPHASIDEIGAYLDSLSQPARLLAIDGLGLRAQRALYRKAASAQPLSLTHFVPTNAAPRQDVCHQGRNTLPLPGRHRRFKKRFCRPDGDEQRLFGYNDAPSQRLIGPGYFVAVPSTAQPSWAERGAIVIDYFQIPDGPVVETWPTVIPNSQGLQRFIYNGTRDFMRQVSAHVSIGAAYKGEIPVGSYFTLCRVENNPR
ncbi:MAG: hypothetical protein AAFV53_27210 [Myxococcota bacterium]